MFCYKRAGTVVVYIYGFYGGLFCFWRWIRSVLSLSAPRNCCITAGKRGTVLQKEDQEDLIVRQQIPPNASNVLPDVCVVKVVRPSISQT